MNTADDSARETSFATNVAAVKASGIAAADLSNLPTQWEDFGHITVSDDTRRQVAAGARLNKAATARDAAHAAWRDSYELPAESGQAATWTVNTIVALVENGDDVQDTVALRVLANRIASGAGSPKVANDAQAALIHVARAAGAMAVAAVDVALVQLNITDAEDETVDELATVVRDLVSASARLEQFARERL